MFLAGCITAGISAVFFILGMVFLIVGKSTWKCTESVKGEIVGMCTNAYQYNHNGNGNTNIRIRVGARHGKAERCPIFVYTVKGVQYNRASNVAWNQGAIKRKMKRPQRIYYNPQNPKQSSLLKQSVLSIVGKVFILVGFGGFILGLIFMKLVM